jgi:hypothetical protein
LRLWSPRQSGPDRKRPHSIPTNAAPGIANQPEEATGETLTRVSVILVRIQDVPEQSDKRISNRVAPGISHRRLDHVTELLKVNHTPVLHDASQTVSVTVCEQTAQLNRPQLALI